MSPFHWDRYERTPAKIDEIVEALRVTWKKNPGQRLGQLLMNLSRVPGGFEDLWEVRDEVWLERLKETK